MPTTIFSASIDDDNNDDDGDHDNELIKAKPS
jgi:hypothetical protein